jgi:hypothetical protein
MQSDSLRLVQSAGLQILGVPGKVMLYFGFTLMIASVFCVFRVAASA